MGKQYAEYGPLEHYYFNGQLKIPGEKRYKIDGVIYGKHKLCFSYLGQV